MRYLRAGLPDRSDQTARLRQRTSTLSKLNYWHTLFGALLVLLSTGLAGCAGWTAGQARAGGAKPFYADHVATVRIVMSAQDWDKTRKSMREEDYVRADLWFDSERIPDVAVRPKGNSSLMTVAQSGSMRMSLKADLNFFNDARNLAGVKKLNFNNGFSDPTLIREALAYALFRQMGVPVPRYSFVNLWVNDLYLGVYTMVEQIDKAFLADHFPSNSGNLYKPEAPGAYLRWTESDLPKASPVMVAGTGDVNVGGGKLNEIQEALGIVATPSTALTPVPPAGIGGMLPGPGGIPGMGIRRGYLESMGLKTNENTANHQGLFRFLEVLNKEPEETFPREIEKVLDVDEVLRFLAVSTVLVHLDNYIGQFAHNYYLYESEGRFTVLPWDLNMAFGGFNLGLDKQRVLNYYIDEPTAGPATERPLVARLLGVPAYLNRYHDYLTKLVDGPFSPAVMNAKIDSLAALIRPYVKNDSLKFFPMASFERGLVDGAPGAARAPGMGVNIGLKDFVVQRGESVRNQLAGKLLSKSANGSGNGGNPGNRAPMAPPAR